VRRSLFLRLLALHVVVAFPAIAILAASIDRIGAGTFALAVMLILFIVGGMSAVVARSTGRSLDRIAAEVRRVSTGEFEQIEPRGPSETRSLADAVNDMAADLGRRELELRSETTLREEVLSAMQEGVILTGPGGEVVYTNTSARRLFGVEQMRVLPPQLPMPEDGGTVTTTVSLHHPVRRDLRCTATRVAGERVLIAILDVTETERIDRIRRDFVANASHEMKTPVAGILATAETLRAAIEDDPDAAKRFAATLAREAGRLSQLIQDLLDLARLDQPEGGEGSVDLSELVDQETSHATSFAKSRSVTIEATIEPGIVVLGRGEDLAALPRNLLDNAIRYTPDGGTVSIDLRAESGDAVLTVRDPGIGIPAKDLPRIFERFYRVDQARSRETGGTGLGLAIVRHVSEAHGGGVHATSQLGRGSTFVVRLPRLP
jgi:signal transduction histidine kinase